MKNCFLRNLVFFKFCRITEFDQTYKCLTSWSFGRFVILYFPGLLIKTNDANLIYTRQILSFGWVPTVDIHWYWCYIRVKTR